MLKKRGHLEVFTSVIYALFLREVNVRFSAGTLGYFWVIFEPLIQISIFVAVKLPSLAQNPILDYAIFITSWDLSPFNLFRHIGR